MDAIQFSATADGSVKAERVIAGVVVDRFIARRDRPLAIKINKPRSWITRAQKLLMEPSAGEIIEVPPIPPLQLSQAEKLAMYESAIDHHNANHDSKESNYATDVVDEQENLLRAARLHFEGKTIG